MHKLLPLLLICLLLTACSRDPLAPMASDAGEHLPAPVMHSLPAKENQAVLWFRFGEEPYLAPETRVLTGTYTDNDATLLLRALIEGPGAASAELRGLFPQGTQVLSCVQSGRVMFVTLSRHILNGYADEPAAWRNDPYWCIEVPLRRELAMQAIAATLTENLPVDAAVILVDHSDTDSLRLRKAYYTLDGDASLADPVRRDERLLLSPARTAEVILRCWQESDWARLYRYIARTDPATGAERPSADDFTIQMAAGKRLLHASAEGGSVHGDSAIFTVSGAYLDGGAEQPFTGMVLRLTREKGVWRLGISQLTGREALP